MKRALATSVIAAFVVGAGFNFPVSSQSFKVLPPPQVFVERPGEMEFTGEMIVRALQMEAAIDKTGSVSAAMALRARARLRVYPDVVRYYPEVDEYIVKVPSGSDENRYAQSLMATGEYQYVEPNWRVFPVLDPNDPLYPQQWHHPKIRSAQAWNTIVGSPTQIIAYTDTGIDVNHPDLAPNRVPGYNAVDQLTEGQGGQVNDINGHGTHVAGIGSAVGNNGIGVTGVGWNFRIMMVRVSNSSGGSSTIDILTRGARWAVDNGAKTISTSYSGVSSSAVETTGQYIRARGSSYLWAAGNSNTNLSGFDHASVIIVGATDQNDAKASFSSYGRAVDVFAPGVNIYSTTRNNTYGNMSGTSMATPMANGVIAMIYAQNPTWTPDQAENKLFTSCIDLGPPGNDDYWGWGRVDLLNAVSGGPTTVQPSSFIVRTGTLIGGNLQSLFNSDDNRLVVNVGPRTSTTAPGTSVEVIAVSPSQTASSITFTVEESTNATSGNMRISALNAQTNSWEVLDQRPVSAVDVTVQMPVSTNASRFIHSSTREMRIRVEVFEGIVAFVPWESRCDLASFTVTP